MYAVIRTGGKQYRVSADDVIEVEKIAGEAGAAVSFDEVMMIGGEGQDAFGKPLVDGARVAAEVVEQKRGPKIIVFKKIRRQNYRRRNGHRQSLTKVRILEILAKGQNPTKKAGERSAVAAAKAAGGQKFELLKAPQGKQDNISLLSGVGPALEKKLHDYGIFHFWQIAAMADADIAKMDEALSLAGVRRAKSGSSRRRN